MARNNRLYVHFMGIGGSGASGVALMAKAMGYEVSGCDLAEITPYLEKVKKAGIRVFVGHDEGHIKGVDILTVSPSIMFGNKKHPEVMRAKKVMTWQHFLGGYLQKGKKVICVAGTHGKSTTTAMAAKLFEDAGLDPWVMIGATVPKWGSNYRIGKGDYFITESDEFFDNFLNYKPNIIILNNIEMDHPDYFKSKRQLFDSFKKHMESVRSGGVLIANWDDKNVRELVEKIKKKIKVVKYSLGDVSSLVFDEDGSRFLIGGRKYSLRLPGKYNVSNALGVIALGKLLRIDEGVIGRSLSSFSGIGRRMELLGERRGVKVYDDYAHHPTAIRATLEGLRQKYPHCRIWCVVEPHSFSRTKKLLKYFKGAFGEADRVVVGPIFRARDSHDFGISGADIVDVCGHKRVEYFEDVDFLITQVKKEARNGDVVIVMGAGESHKWARKLLE